MIKRTFNHRSPVGRNKRSALRRMSVIISQRIGHTAGPIRRINPGFHQSRRVGNLLPTWIVLLWLNAWAAKLPTLRNCNARATARGLSAAVLIAAVGRNALRLLRPTALNCRLLQ